MYEYKIYYIIDFERIDDAIKQIEYSLKASKYEIKTRFNHKIVKLMYDQPYISIGLQSKGNSDKYSLDVGYMPLIDTEKNPMSEYYYGVNYYKKKGYKFGGYINCTKEEVDDYIRMFANVNKFNV